MGIKYVSCPSNVEIAVKRTTGSSSSFLADEDRFSEVVHVWKKTENATHPQYCKNIYFLFNHSPTHHGSEGHCSKNNNGYGSSATPREFNNTALPKYMKVYKSIRV